MKLVLLLFGVVVLASLAYARPAGCEDEPEAPPVPVGQQQLDTADQQSSNLSQAKQNVIDPPKVCPDGQKLDHQGKCRPVMG
uniref:Uncharacterized protein n=1 Tax=Anopheles funestus TaxID=62324 RepID=A0A4Y0BGQ6_ANOFN